MCTLGGSGVSCNLKAATLSSLICPFARYSRHSAYLVWVNLPPGPPPHCRWGDGIKPAVWDQDSAACLRPLSESLTEMRIFTQDVSQLLSYTCTPQAMLSVWVILAFVCTPFHDCSSLSEPLSCKRGKVGCKSLQSRFFLNSTPPFSL